MNRDDRMFHVRKNNLDNQHARILAYFQMVIVGLITVSVGAVIFLLQKASFITAIQSSLFSIIGVFVAALVFTGKLNRITEEISEMSSSRV